MSAWQNLEFRTWRKLSSGLCLWGQILVKLVAVGRPILAVVGLSHGQGLLDNKKMEEVSWALAGIHPLFTEDGCSMTSCPGSCCVGHLTVMDCTLNGKFK